MSLSSKLLCSTTKIHLIKPCHIKIIRSAVSCSVLPIQGQKFRFAHTMTNLQQSIPLTEVPNDSAAALVQEYPNGLCEIQLNRPKKLNAFNDDMCNILSENIVAWEKSEKSKAILVKGNGKAFCAGGDIKALLDLEDAGRHPESAAIFYRHCRLQHLIGSLKTPYIALMDGITMGAGVGLVMNAPFRIATENTLYSMPENSIGHFNDASASFWMPRFDGQMGRYLGVTSSRLRGVDAFYAGIATHYVPAKNLPELEDAIQNLAAKSDSRLALDAINTTIEYFSTDLDKDVPKFSLGGNGIYQAINRCYKHNTVEEIIAALEEEKIAIEWARQTIDQLNALSPTAMKTSLELFRRGKQLSLLECMALESKLASRTMAEREFSEGVRATVVTRQKPNWQPSSLKEVDLNELKRLYFDAPDNNPLKPFIDGGHFKEYQQGRYMLPSCSEILEVAKKTGTTVGTIKNLKEKYNGKKGVQAKIINILQ